MMEDGDSVAIEHYCSTTPGVGFLKPMIRYEGMFCSYRLPWCMDFNSCWCLLS